MTTTNWSKVREFLHEKIPEIEHKIALIKPDNVQYKLHPPSSYHKLGTGIIEVWITSENASRKISNDEVKRVLNISEEEFLQVGDYINEVFSSIDDVQVWRTASSRVNLSNSDRKGMIWYKFGPADFARFSE